MFYLFLCGTQLLRGALLDGDVRVELEHHLDVLQWVLLHCHALAAGAAWAESGLDLIGLRVCFVRI